MKNIKLIAKIFKWGLRCVLFIAITYVVLDYGMGLIYSLMCAFVFMVFWIWLMWYDYKVNPVIK